MFDPEQKFEEAKKRPEEKESVSKADKPEDNHGLRPLTFDDFEKSLGEGREERGSAKERITQIMDEVLGGSRAAEITFKISARPKINVLLDMARKGEIEIKRNDEVVLQTAFDTGRWDANRRKIDIIFTDRFNEKAKDRFIKEFGNLIGRIETID